MVQVLRSNYDRGILVDKSFLRKTAELVRAHTSTHAIREPGTEYKITADTLEAIASRDQPDTVKVFNLLKAVEQLVAASGGREPYLLSIGDKAEQIARSFEERQKTTQETLEELRRLIREVTQARQERDASQLSPEAFAVYWLLKREDVAQADVIAQAAGQAFAAYPHWRISSHQEQEVRKAFYKALIDAGVDGVVDVARQILQTLWWATE
jgi:type I restriction enzyme R subunit